LLEFGTWRLEDALAFAIDYADNGFPVASGMRLAIDREADLIARWPSSRDLYLPPPEVGSQFRNPTLAVTYRRIVDEARGGSRDEEIERVLWVWGSRIADLKKDARFKYIAVFKNQGTLAGDEWSHAYSQITATIFVPRRVKYELNSASEWFRERERCIFCDVVRQDEKQGKRIVDVQGDYYALCPYSSRVPYEVWLLHRRHNHLFEQPRPGANRRQLAALLGRVLRRLEQVAPAFHLVVHTAPNTLNKKGEMAGYWKTLADDFHWHIEILPILEKRSKSYSIKEVYFNAVLPENAAEQLRSLDSNP